MYRESSLCNEKASSTASRILAAGRAGFADANFLLRKVPKHAKTRFMRLDRLTYAGNVTNLQAIEDAAGAGERYRFVHISTDEVFGSLGDTGAFREDTPYDPRSPYSASKAAADHFARSYFHTYGLPVVITNGSNNYGPLQFPEKLIPVVITSALEGREIPVYGTGEDVRDWLFVADHCAALEAVLDGGTPGETYLIGGDSEARNFDLVKQICDLVDAAEGRPDGFARELITFVDDRPGHDYRYAIDFSKLRDELGWTPTHALDDGLRATVDWYLRSNAWLEAVRDGA